MFVLVPEGAGPGTQLTVTTPTGQQHTVECPPGVVPGQHIQLDLPDPTAAPTPLPVVMADAVPVAAPAPTPVVMATPAAAEASSTPAVAVGKATGGAAGAQLDECPSPAPAPAVDELYSWLQTNRLEQCVE
jgi:hypothetical protein